MQNKKQFLTKRISDMAILNGIAYVSENGKLYKANMTEMQTVELDKIQWEETDIEQLTGSDRNICELVIRSAFES